MSGVRYEVQIEIGMCEHPRPLGPVCAGAGGPVPLEKQGQWTGVVSVVCVHLLSLWMSAGPRDPEAVEGGGELTLA